MHTFFLGEGIKFKPRIKIEFAAVLKLGVWMCDNLKVETRFKPRRGCAEMCGSLGRRALCRAGGTDASVTVPPPLFAEVPRGGVSVVLLGDGRCGLRW